MSETTDPQSDTTEPQTVGESLTLGADAGAVLDVDVEITAVLGTATMPISQILKLGRGAVVELDRGVNQDIEIHANNRTVATGEVVVVDNQLGVNINQIIKLANP